MLTQVLPIILFQLFFLVSLMLNQIFGLRANENYKVDSTTSTFGLQQVINEPTHIIGDFSSCIDLTFTPQPILVMKSGVHSSLHPYCHHQITYSKFNLKIYYPPPYEREI